MMAETTRPDTYRVLFVCTGNTCRSPMAEGVLRLLAEERGDSEIAIEALSAGTMGMIDQPASDYSVDVAAQHGIDLSGHRSRDASLALLNSADLILALADEHEDYCRRLGVSEDRLSLLLSFPDNAGGLTGMSVPDPIGRSRDVYERVFFIIEEAIRRGFPKIVRFAQEKAGHRE